MSRFLVIIALDSLIVHFFLAVVYLKRIADALEDLVYDDKEAKEKNNEKTNIT